MNEPDAHQHASHGPRSVAASNSGRLSQVCGWRLAAWAGSLAVLLVLNLSPAKLHAIELDVAIGGGPILAWDDTANVGNGFGLYTALHIHELVAVGIGAATVLPDSRIQAQFGAFWVEGRVHPFGRDGLWTPYALIGLGFATGDSVEDSDTLPELARWNEDSPSALGLLGVGVRLGNRTGLFATVDLRAFNASHAGAHLSAGYAF